MKDKRSEMLDKIKAFEKELGNPVSTLYAIRASKAVSTGERAPRRSRRKEVLDAITGSMYGLTKSELLEVLGIVGNKTAMTAVSNVLSIMTKGGVIQLAGKGSKYTVDRRIIK